MSNKCVILVSGGIDSSTVLALAAKQGFEIHAISFKYGQRHTIELECVKNVLEDFPIKQHKIIEINLRNFGGSALTDDIDVPSYSGAETLPDDVPVTYVPARNTIFLSYALAYAEVIKASDIFIGVHKADHANYPDCRPEFITSFEQTANLATAFTTETKQKIRINAPLLHMLKSEIVILGTELGVDYGKTISCYNPDDEGISCGTCLSCTVRKAAFTESGIVDPTKYSH